MPFDPRVSQFAEGLPFSVAAAVCGPALALAFVRANGGQTPTLAEAKELAERGGFWRAGVGMLGPQAEVSLMRKLGVDATYTPGVDWASVTERAGRGEIIGLSTPEHYWQISGYDPASQRYFVGTSGTDMKRGSAWMTADEIADVGGGLHGLITMPGGPRARPEQQFLEVNTELPAPETPPLRPTPTAPTALEEGTAPAERAPADRPGPAAAAPDVTDPFKDLPPQLVTPFRMPGAADDPMTIWRNAQEAERKRGETALLGSLAQGFATPTADRRLRLPDVGLSLAGITPGGFRLPGG